MPGEVEEGEGAERDAGTGFGQAAEAGQGGSGEEVFGGDVVVEVTELKEKLDGEIIVYASRTLVKTLIEHDIVDELRLMIYPVLLGAGERLFGETSTPKRTRLLRSRTVGDSLAYLTYEIVREP